MISRTSVSGEYFSAHIMPSSSTPCAGPAADVDDERCFDPPVAADDDDDDDDDDAAPAPAVVLLLFARLCLSAALVSMANTLPSGHPLLIFESSARRPASKPGQTVCVSVQLYRCRRVRVLMWGRDSEAQLVGGPTSDGSQGQQVSR
jgi:hypothetical protein